jgi:hypothetical protein
LPAHHELIRQSIAVAAELLSAAALWVPLIK